MITAMVPQGIGQMVKHTVDRSFAGRAAEYAAYAQQVRASALAATIKNEIKATGDISEETAANVVAETKAARHWGTEAQSRLRLSRIPVGSDLHLLEMALAEREKLISAIHAAIEILNTSNANYQQAISNIALARDELVNAIG